VSVETHTSTSEIETRAVAAALASRLRPGDVLLLHGDLGTGKTAFVRGLAAGLGIDPDDVTSPTFTLVHEYRGGRLPIVHVDLYRVDGTDLDDIGLDEALARAGIVAIEWAERLTWAGTEAIRVQISDRGGDVREIVIVVGDERD
jgi:tRNA threonylcarbamoyladenosine biosynthesis protein TsaE